MSIQFELFYQIPENDHFYAQHNQRCMNFVRSNGGVRPGCRLGPRETENRVSLETKIESILFLWSEAEILLSRLLLCWMQMLFTQTIRKIWKIWDHLREGKWRRCQFSEIMDSWIYCHCLWRILMKVVLDPVRMSSASRLAILVSMNRQFSACFTPWWSGIIIW